MSVEEALGKSGGCTTAKWISELLCSFRSPTSSVSPSSGISRPLASSERSDAAYSSATAIAVALTPCSARRRSGPSTRLLLSTRRAGAGCDTGHRSGDAGEAMASHWSMPSTGGSPHCAARVSVWSTPASAHSVVYQSATWMGATTGVPRTATGTAPPATSAAARTPPSSGVYLPPRSGKLVEALSSRSTGPPLSDVSTSRVSSHMPLAFSLSTRAPTESSSVFTIAAYCALQRITDGPPPLPG
mmetsp:Transcript_20203/g.62604  ORF Transcript_20203/g.62604 Transcript_20203/m.62604 type:complete len:244 (+) Transcript_20203:330-1061(+)